MSDGSVQLVAPDGSRYMFIRPVKIYDTSGTDITPSGLKWKVKQIGGAWFLQLELHDSSFPLPYVIDPSSVTTNSCPSGRRPTSSIPG